MTGQLVDVTGPELSSFKRWRVDHKLISLLVIGGCGLDSLHVRAMGEFSLGVASQDLKFLALRNPVVGLLLGS